jgi:hypothetical protein
VKNADNGPGEHLPDELDAELDLIGDRIGPELPKPRRGAR